MAIESLADVINPFSDLRVRLAAVQDAARASDLPIEDLASAHAELSGILQDGRALFADLGQLEAVTLLQIPDGQRTVVMWKWRRDTRFALALFLRSVSNLLELITSAIRGFSVRLYTVNSVDTLQSIAQRELGDWQAWPRLMASNPGINPESLKAGDTLIIPAIEQ